MVAICVRTMYQCGKKTELFLVYKGPYHLGQSDEGQSLAEMSVVF